MMAVMMMMVVVVEEIMMMVTVVAEVGECGGEDEMVGMVVIFFFFWCQIGYSLEVLTCWNSKNILQRSPCINIPLLFFRDQRTKSLDILDLLVRNPQRCLAKSLKIFKRK